MASTAGNKKIAKTRGSRWKQNLIIGRLDSELHPTKLKLGRIRRQISQTLLAKKLGISIATYGAIERAKRPAMPTTAKKIAAELKFNPTQLFRIAEGKYIAVK